METSKGTSRKVIDCRDQPSDKQCSLMISGKEDEVLKAATEHAVSAHGEKDTPEFREKLKGSMKDEGGSFESEDKSKVA
jgi:predicted small metal-binding protein